MPVLLIIPIWLIIASLPIVPVTMESSDYTFEDNDSFINIALNGFIWTHTGRVGWCGNEPIREWTHTPNMFFVILIGLCWIPLYLIFNWIWNNSKRHKSDQHISENKP